MRNMILLNRVGDVSITWTEAEDDKMKEIIQKMIDKGYRFFIVEEKKRLGFTVNTTKDIKKAKKIKNKQVFIDEEDLEALANQGLIKVERTDEGDINTTGYAKDAREVLNNNTMATRPIAGG